MASSLQERITADRAKSSLARKLLYTSGHSIVATEISDFNNPDIISLTKSDRLVEYEIKVSKADLMGELNSVKTCKNQMLMNTHNRAIQGEQQMQIGDKTVTAHFRGNIFEPEGLYKDIGKCSKLDKHERYLIPKPSERTAFGDYDHPYRPNQFYFAVPGDLVELAMSVCEGTAYGVINLDHVNGSIAPPMKAGYIHRNEASRYDIHRMARSLAFGYWDNRISLERRVES